MRVTVNGRAFEAEPHPDATLLELLRDDLLITSPKDGCSPMGQCGCCTVLLDGHATISCQLPATKAEGRAVTTVEGLDPAERSRMAEAFAATGALQCGFCTPGIVMRVAGLLNKKGSALTRDDAARHLGAHLCRCTGYIKILDAVDILASGDPAPAAPASGRVGERSLRYQGLDLALGDKPYIDDLILEGMLHGAFRLTEHARAVVQSIDVGEAAAVPGVACILTAADIPGAHRQGLLIDDWPVMVGVGETTAYCGDVVACVAAETRRAARDAAALIKVAYEVLEPVTDPRRVLVPDAPVIHEGGNLAERTAYKRGAPIEGVLAASAHTVHEVFTTQRVEHAFLEPEAALAVPQDDGRLHLLTGGQGIWDDRRQAAVCLGEPEDNVRVTLCANGGAFGGKEDSVVASQAALLARATGRPVKLVLSREESFKVHAKRHPLELEVWAGCDDDGHLTGLKARIMGDTGAYLSVGNKVLERAAGHVGGPYQWPAIDVEALCVYTNNPVCGAFRGFGANQAMFACDGVLDRLAEKVGLSGWEMRHRNALRPGGVFGPGQVMDDSCGIVACLEAIKPAYDAAVTGGKAVGLGAGLKNSGLGNGFKELVKAEVDVSPDGQRVTVRHPWTEMGQGMNTVAQQVACTELGLPPEQVMVTVDTERELGSGQTTGSRGTMMGGRAIIDACGRLKDAWDGTLASVAGRTFAGTFLCDWTAKPGDPDGKPIHMAFSFAAQMVVLGDNGRVERVTAAHDVGKAINPTLLEGQIEGSVHMGLGYALSEDFPTDEAGQPRFMTLRQLGIIRPKDMPPVDVIVVEVPCEHGPYGAKGVGEIGLVPTAGAVAAALHAHDGVWRDRLPMRGA